MRELKFRAWDPICEKMWTPIVRSDGLLMVYNQIGSYITLPVPSDPLMQFTGMTDKYGDGTLELYEGDVIGHRGEIKGSIYEVDAVPGDIVVPVITGEDWHRIWPSIAERGWGYRLAEEEL